MVNTSTNITENTVSRKVIFLCMFGSLKWFFGSVLWCWKMAAIDFYVYSLHSFISLQNLPRDALPDGSPVREKLANFKRPKKFKTSENDYSHGSFFLRIGGISKFCCIRYDTHMEFPYWKTSVTLNCILAPQSGGPLNVFFNLELSCVHKSRIQKSWNIFKWNESSIINISWDGVKPEVNWGIYLIKLSMEDGSLKWKLPSVVSSSSPSAVVCSRVLWPWAAEEAPTTTLLLTHRKKRDKCSLTHTTTTSTIFSISPLWYHEDGNGATTIITYTL